MFFLSICARSLSRSSSARAIAGHPSSSGIHTNVRLCARRFHPSAEGHKWLHRQRHQLRFLYSVLGLFRYIDLGTPVGIEATAAQMALPNSDSSVFVSSSRKKRNSPAPTKYQVISALGVWVVYFVVSFVNRIRMLNTTTSESAAWSKKDFSCHIIICLL